MPIHHPLGFKQHPLEDASIYMGEIPPVTYSFSDIYSGLIPFATSKGPPCMHGH